MNRLNSLFTIHIRRNKNYILAILLERKKG